MTEITPSVYAPRIIPAKISFAGQLGALALAGACAAVLIIAARLQPSPDGLGTHTELGLNRCYWIQQWNLPCPSCGMTTSFAHFAHGQLLGSFYVQLMGAVLAILTTATFWGALYIAWTGKPAWRLLRIIPTRYYVLPLMLFGIAAWGWKMYIHL